MPQHFADTAKQLIRSIFANNWRSIFAIVALPLGALIHNSGAAAVADAKLGVEIALLAAAVALLLPTVIIALHHAEKIAARIGEPYGTLLLTLAVTIIEVSIIVSIMLNGSNNPTLARESVFSVMMIVCTGGVGFCLTLGALRHGEQDHLPLGTNSYLAVLMALSVLSLILPNFTLTTAGGTYSTLQLIFVSGLSVLLYSTFLYIQTVRHRSYFVEEAVAPQSKTSHTFGRPLWINIVCLLASLATVVLLAERVAAGVESGLDAIGVTRTDAIIGALIAILLLFPELLAAIKAALHNQLQRSINILLGSALATIGLTIPAVAAASLITGRELTLGLVSRDEVLLLLALALSMISFGTGRTNVLTGMVHLVVFFAYLMLLVIP